MRTYSTRRFARLAGVTVKTLRHYERVGLLRPKRNGADYRRYSPADLQRLDRILALKSLGLTLAMIKTTLAGGVVRLGRHRASLEEQRLRIDRSIDALSRIEREPCVADAMDRYIRDAGWDRWETERLKRAVAISRASDRAPQSRVALFREVLTALAGRPVCTAALRELWTRCRVTIEPETLAALKTRHDWPSGMRRYVASLCAMTPEEWECVAAFLDDPRANERRALT